MSRIFPKAGWMLAGVLALYVLSALAGVATGGPLDPPGSPGPTMHTVGSIPPSWFPELASTDGDGEGCGSSRFVCVMNGQAVLDNETGLVWEREASGSATTWANAIQDCHQFQVIDDRKGWRLPTAAELATLIDTTGSPITVAANSPFTNVGAFGFGPYWTSTVDPASSTAVLMVDFYTGNVLFGWPKGGTPPEFIEHVWCVRAAGDAY